MQCMVSCHADFTVTGFRSRLERESRITLSQPTLCRVSSRVHFHSLSSISSGKERGRSFCLLFHLRTFYCLFVRAHSEIFPGYILCPFWILETRSQVRSRMECNSLLMCTLNSLQSTSTRVFHLVILTEWLYYAVNLMFAFSLLAHYNNGHFGIHDQTWNISPQCNTVFEEVFIEMLKPTFFILQIGRASCRERV